jgi:hypothetical protein
LARIGAAGIVLRQKWSRGQVEARLANLPPWTGRLAQPSLFSVLAVAAADD